MIKRVYTFRVSPKGETDIYRDIKIDGEAKMDSFSSAILRAYNFDDNDHLYMFSKSRIRFDIDGIYHPGAQGGNDASLIKIQDLGLKVRNKILFLYDFGDEWMFDVTVKKIEDTGLRVIPHVIESQGFVKQYYDESDEYYEEDEEDESDDEDEEESDDGYEPDEPLEIPGEFVVKKGEDTVHTVLGFWLDKQLLKVLITMGVSVKTRKKDLHKEYVDCIDATYKNEKHKILNVLTSLGCKLLIQIVDGTLKKGKLTHDYFKCFTTMFLLGFVDLEVLFDDFGNQTLSVNPSIDLKEYVSFLKEEEFLQEIDRREKIDKALYDILSIYGVLEPSMVLEFLHDYYDIDISENELFEKIFCPRIMCDDYRVVYLNSENGEKVFYTIYTEERAMIVMTYTHDFKSQDYMRLSPDEINLIRVGDWSDIIPSYAPLRDFLVDNFCSEYDFYFFHKLIVFCMNINMDIDDIASRCNKFFTQDQQKEFEKAKELIKTFLVETPLASLKGFSLFTLHTI